MLFDVVKHAVVVMCHQGQLHHHHLLGTGDVGHQLFVELQVVFLESSRLGRFLLDLGRCLDLGLARGGFQLLELVLRGEFGILLEVA